MSTIFQPSSPEPAGSRHMFIFVGATAAIVALAALGTLWPFADRWLWSAGIPRGDILQLTADRVYEGVPSLSPDGEWIAYRSDATGNGDIVVRNINTAQMINLTSGSPLDETEPAFSPDGRLIAFRSRQGGDGINVVNRTGGQARRLTRGGASPAWTPDGRFIVYATQGSLDDETRVQVSAGFKVQVGTGAATRLTMGDFRQPSVSPHGRRVAYWAIPVDRFNRQRIGGTRGDIWTIDLDGRHPPVRVTAIAASHSSPIWSADGRFLSYVSNRSGTNAIWRVPINERTGVPLGTSVQVATPSSEPAHLTVSADGRRLAWSTLRRIRHVQRMDFNSDARGPRGQPFDVATGDAAWSRAEPSPDGSALVLSSVDGHAGLHVARADGSDPRRLTNDPAVVRDPRWSPDGRRIVFQSERAGANSVWVVNADGSGLRMLTGAAGELQHPIWSPDGTRVVAWDPYRMGNRIFRVDDGGAPDPVDTLPQVVGRPFLPSDWSPDGRLIAGTASGSLYIYSVEDRTYELVGRGSNPVWLNDSRRLVYSSDGRLFLVDAVTKFADDRRLWREMLAIPGDELDVPRLSRDNRYLYFTRARTEADLWMMTVK